jgi:sporulation protein YqfC
MHEHMKIKKQLSDTFRFPDDVLMDTPVVKIIADNEVMIENHKGICEYTNSFLKIYTSIGVIRIAGRSLYIKEIDKDVILICGKIDSLDYIK